MLVGVYTVAAWCNVRDRVVGVAAHGHRAHRRCGQSASLAATGADVAFNFVLFTAAYLFGSTVRNRRLYSEQLEERADAFEHERDEEAKRAVADERLRIAQELHDVVAHSMGVIAVQAGVGAHVIDTDPAEAKKAFEAISQTSRRRWRRSVACSACLRDDEGAAYEPAPGLAELDRLVRDVRAAGTRRRRARARAARTELPPGVDFTAYRIVQEALTNVLKHAGPAQATRRRRLRGQGACASRSSTTAAA